MGNLLSVLIGCVGAVELITLLNQITARAELEYERLCLSEMGQCALEETSSAESRKIIQNILNTQSAASGSQAVPQIHFDTYEKGAAVAVESTAPVVDGLKYRPLVRDDGTGRRRAFKKRDSSGSIDSKLSREEELRMFTSLEEEEFRAMTEGDYQPISYGSEPDGLKIRKHHKRHRKSPISDIHREDSLGTISSSEVNDETLSEETEDEVTYPWGDINPEHHKSSKHQKEKTLSIGELNEEDEKLGSSVESNKDLRNNIEAATKTSVADDGAHVTVSSAVVEAPGTFEAPPRSFACIDQPDPVLEDANETKVEEWLNHGHIRDSYSPAGTLTRSKRYLQMESMDVQDGDTSTPTTDFTVDDVDANGPTNNHNSEEISEESSSHLEFHSGIPPEHHKSPSPEEISQEFFEHDDEEADEEKEEESLVSGEDEIEDFDDIVNALRKNVPKEEVKFDDLLEKATQDSQKSDVFSVSPDREGSEVTTDDEEEEFSFPARDYAAYNEFPLENMIPYSESLPNKSDRCEILDQIRRENQKRNRNAGPDKYFAPRPSIIDFPAKLEIVNLAMKENLKVFPLININDDQSFPTLVVPVRKDVEVEQPRSLPSIEVQESDAIPPKSPIPNMSDAAEGSKTPSRSSQSAERTESPAPATTAKDDLTKFLNTERLSVSPARKSVERTESNLRIVDRDDPMMNLLKDSMFPY